VTPADPDLASLVANAGVPARNRAVVGRMIADALELASGPADELDLKIASAALAEMGDAFTMFAPHRSDPKVAVFGSARIQRDDPLYAQATAVASLLAAEGWKVITGAGPGLMTAAMEGAGREHSFGVTIRLPFENAASSVVLDEKRNVAMKYFFTRKLMLIKESKGFICLPGGFGTLDEMFELLTLTQTGKGVPVPIVLLDPPGDPFWEGITSWVTNQLVRRGFIGQDDCNLFLVTESAERACREICDFYRVFDSIRYVGELLVIRMRTVPTADQLARWNDDFADICTTGRIETVGPTRAEQSDRDRIDLARVALRFNPRKQGRLRLLIDAINSTASPDGSSL
jgi:uncharacterized protein (TIGR00730 family)